MRLYSVLAKLTIAFMFIAAAMMFTAIGCDGGSRSYTGFGDGDLYHVTKQACAAAIQEQWAADHRKKLAATSDAQGVPQQAEVPAEPTKPAYKVLYTTDNTDRDNLVINDAPEGVLTVVTALVDKEGNLYFFDEPNRPLSGWAKSRWQERQAAAKAEKSAEDDGASESLTQLANATKAWNWLKPGDRVVTTWPEPADPTAPMPFGWAFSFAKILN